MHEAARLSPAIRLWGRFYQRWDGRDGIRRQLPRRVSILGFIGGDKADPSVDMTLYTLTIIQALVINSSYNLSAAASEIVWTFFCQDPPTWQLLRQQPEDGIQRGSLPTRQVLLWRLWRWVLIISIPQRVSSMTCQIPWRPVILLPKSILPVKSVVQMSS